MLIDIIQEDSKPKTIYPEINASAQFNNIYDYTIKKQFQHFEAYKLFLSPNVYFVTRTYFSSELF